MKDLIAFCMALAVPFGAAFASDKAVSDADIVIIGESHDNAAHHAAQADLVARLGPSAIVFEMLDWDSVRAVRGVDRTDATAMAKATRWEDRGWPDFEAYAPIFAAAPKAVLYAGHLNGRKASDLVKDGVFFAMPDRFRQAGLAAPLPQDQQKAREDMQFAAHCDALPRGMLPMMVDIQRARDATLAYAALRAFEAHGGPVVMITGNGHARTDWGVPVFLAKTAPEVSVVSIGQGEAGSAPNGSFTMILDGPSVDREEPCAAFR